MTIIRDLRYHGVGSRYVLNSQREVFLMTMQVQSDQAALLKLRRGDIPLGTPEVVWSPILSSASSDSVVGIRHAEISGDSSRRVHVAAIPERVGCHFHRKGREDYSVVRGQGVMHFGMVDESAGQPVVNQWHALPVSVGDTFTIPEGYAHQLVKTGNEDLVILFACPDSHLNDSEDRTMMADSPGVRG